MDGGLQATIDVRTATHEGNGPFAPPGNFRMMRLPECHGVKDTHGHLVFQLLRGEGKVIQGHPFQQGEPLIQGVNSPSYKEAPAPPDHERNMPTLSFAWK